MSINISKVWQRHLFKLCKLCKQEVHFKLIYMQTPCHAKTPSTGIFLSQTEPMMCSTQLKGQRWQAGVLNLIFSHLDSTCPLPFMIIKPIYIEKLYREDCHIKLSRMSDFQSSTFAEKGRGKCQVVEHDVLLCHTNLSNHHPSLVVRGWEWVGWGGDKNPSCAILPSGKEF